VAWKVIYWGWSEGDALFGIGLGNWKREEPVDEAKPFKIPNQEAWEAFKRMKVNRGRLV
jgi:hypothetical protein